MKYEKRNCEECGKEFTPKGRNQYGIQKFCSKKCNNIVSNKRRTERRRKEVASKKREVASKKREVASIKKNDYIKNGKEIRKVSFKEEINNIHQPLYQVRKGINLIRKFDKIYEGMVNYMNILKLDTYPEEVRNHCIYIMKESVSFLQNQLKSKKDRGVIIVQEE